MRGRVRLLLTTSSSEGGKIGIVERSRKKSSGARLSAWLARNTFDIFFFFFFFWCARNQWYFIIQVDCRVGSVAKLTKVKRRSMGPFNLFPSEKQEVNGETGEGPEWWIQSRYAESPRQERFWSSEDTECMLPMAVHPVAIFPVSASSNFFGVSLQQAGELWDPCILARWIANLATSTFSSERAWWFYLNMLSELCTSEPNVLLHTAVIREMFPEIAMSKVKLRCEHETCDISQLRRRNPLI